MSSGLNRNEPIINTVSCSPRSCGYVDALIPVRYNDCMTNRERVKAVLTCKSYDRLPLVHFGFWDTTLEQWKRKKYITEEEVRLWYIECPGDRTVTEKLGFDCNWNSVFRLNTTVFPLFEKKVLREHSDGSREVHSPLGVTELEMPGVTSIPSEIDHLLKDRASWEKHYLPRLQYTEERLYNHERNDCPLYTPFQPDGLNYLKDNGRAEPVGLHCGSLFGEIRNWLGITGVSYLFMDDRPLLDEIIDTVGGLVYRCVKEMLATGAVFDYAHFWEDICFKNGPLIMPAFFYEKVGPHYRRITSLIRDHGIDIISLDCDGCIDSLIPTWFENGVNTMFPIEVGTWKASIEPWRRQYGKGLLGVGGMDKNVFSKDYAAVDAEIERLKSLVDLGGYLPCPDHRIAPDAKWDNVKYYCGRMRETFG